MVTITINLNNDGIISVIGQKSRKTYPTMLCCSWLKIDRTGRHLVMLVFWVKVDRHTSWCCDWQDVNLEYSYTDLWWNCTDWRCSASWDHYHSSIEYLTGCESAIASRVSCGFFAFTKLRNDGQVAYKLYWVHWNTSSTWKSTDTTTSSGRFSSAWHIFYLDQGIHIEQGASPGVFVCGHH